ncbi:hypothetical protein TSAR_015443 [Trichomalopsis sarcophagae]|uniref:Odorant receptor n=1 Tax=Trichomalopsis sarcophagae TaxID=543379 RepID=A0A232FCU6_9HYME|nr:hypothetical protein TSAR_015443 [Trichomalopsis sarcophagae]
MSTQQSEYAVQMSRYFLRPIGLWSSSSSSRSQAYLHNLLNLLLIVITYLLIMFILVPCALHTFIEEPNMAIKMKLIGPMSFALMAVTKYASLTQKTAVIAQCFRHVEEDWESGCAMEKKVMYRHAKIGRSLSIFSGIFMYGGGIFYHGIMPMAAVQTFSASIDGSLSLNTSSVFEVAKKPRILTFPTYNAWLNIEISPIYEIVYLLQCFSGYVLDTITVGTCSLAAVFVTHTCAQLELVMMLIRRYIDGDVGPDDVPYPKDATTREARLAVIVTRHIRALKFAARVEKYLNGICFVEFIGCTMNICFIGYYCLTEWERKEPISTTTYFILLASFTTNIFIFCYIGELLTEQCTRVGSIYHAIDWYNLPGKSASDLFFIIAISRYPAKLTAGKFVDLTLVTFSNVMKSAFTYFNLIRTVII